MSPHSPDLAPSKSHLSYFIFSCSSVFWNSSRPEIICCVALIWFWKKRKEKGQSFAAKNSLVLTFFLTLSWWCDDRTGGPDWEQWLRWGWRCLQRRPASVDGAVWFLKCQRSSGPPHTSTPTPPKKVKLGVHLSARGHTDKSKQSAGTIRLEIRVRRCSSSSSREELHLQLHCKVTWWRI